MCANVYGLAKKPKRMLIWNTNVDVYHNVHLKYLTAFLPNRCYVLGGLSALNLI